MSIVIIRFVFITGPYAFTLHDFISVGSSSVSPAIDTSDHSEDVLHHRTGSGGMPKSSPDIRIFGYDHSNVALDRTFEQKPVAAVGQVTGFCFPTILEQKRT